jgi:ParB family chromosome partitioning protein
MSKHLSLGRGLNSLIPPKFRKIDLNENKNENKRIENVEKILNISVEKIKSNPQQPRQYFNLEELDELVKSIREYGIIQPLIVTKVGEDSYELIAGERRLRAAKILKLKTVPVILREAKEQEKLELALIENIQRENLNPIEEALAYQKLINEFNLSQEEIARKVGKSRSAVTNTLRLLNLPIEIQKALIDGKITVGHAKSILSLDTPSEQLNLFKKILENNLNVREVEKGVRKIQIKKGRFKDKKTPLLLSKEETLRNYLGTKVEVKKKGDSGKIIIYFYSDEELNSIFRKIVKSR